MTVGTATVAALFERELGGAPAGFWRAPGRVNLIGEHTDYNDGFVLPFAIDRATTVALSPRDDDRIRLVSTFDETLVESDLDAVAERRFAGLVRLPARRRVGDRRAGRHADRHGFDVAVHSDVPVGAGLSSSAAIEMAVAVALNDVWALGLGPHRARPDRAARGERRRRRPDRDHGPVRERVRRAGRRGVPRLPQPRGASRCRSGSTPPGSCCS